MVDSSVWIDRYRGRNELPHVRLLTDAIETREIIVVGDVVLLEISLGVATDLQAAKVEAQLRTFRVEAMIDPELAVLAAKHYRTLRTAGITIRKTIDLIIGTFCIDRRCRLLHNDRDFEPMHDLLGLRRA